MGSDGSQRMRTAFLSERWWFKVVGLPVSHGRRALILSLCMILGSQVRVLAEICSAKSVRVQPTGPKEEMMTSFVS